VKALGNEKKKNREAILFLWTSLGLNQGPPDYESERIQFYEIFFV
jgi:hypothetical protein